MAAPDRVTWEVELPGLEGLGDAGNPTHAVAPPPCVRIHLPELPARAKIVNYGSRGLTMDCKEPSKSHPHGEELLLSVATYVLDTDCSGAQGLCVAATVEPPAGWDIGTQLIVWDISDGSVMVCELSDYLAATRLDDLPQIPRRLLERPNGSILHETEDGWRGLPLRWAGRVDGRLRGPWLDTPASDYSGTIGSALRGGFLEGSLISYSGDDIESVLGDIYASIELRVIVEVRGPGGTSIIGALGPVIARNNRDRPMWEVDGSYYLGAHRLSLSELFSGMDPSVQRIGCASLSRSVEAGTPWPAVGDPAQPNTYGIQFPGTGLVPLHAKRAVLGLRPGAGAVTVGEYRPWRAFLPPLSAPCENGLAWSADNFTVTPVALVDGHHADGLAFSVAVASKPDLPPLTVETEARYQIRVWTDDASWQPPAGDFTLEPADARPGKETAVVFELNGRSASASDLSAHFLADFTVPRGPSSFVVHVDVLIYVGINSIYGPHIDTKRVRLPDITIPEL